MRNRKLEGYGEKEQGRWRKRNQLKGVFRKSSRIVFRGRHTQISGPTEPQSTGDSNDMTFSNFLHPR
jgi:hypothetical protein